MLLGTVELRTLGRAAVVAKRVARASSLQSTEPAFNLSIPFSGSSFIGVQTPEYMTPIGQPIETLDQWPPSVIIGWGGETPPRSPCLTGEPIKNYGPCIARLGHPAFFLYNIRILC